MYKKILILTISLVVSGCSLSSWNNEATSQKQVVKKEKAQKEVQNIAIKEKEVKFDWKGYYYGLLPCASCPGIETWLHLDKTNDKKTYNLVENYIEEVNGVFTKKGDFSWVGTTSVAKLSGYDPERYIFVDKTFASLLGSPNGSIKNEYTLIKLDTFIGDLEELLVIPESIQIKKIEGKNAVQFNALKNIKYTNNFEQKSIKAQYIVYCDIDSYQIPKAIYYTGFFATGQRTLGKNEKLINFKGQNDVLKQAQKKYCSK